MYGLLADENTDRYRYIHGRVAIDVCDVSAQFVMEFLESRSLITFEGRDGIHVLTSEGLHLDRPSNLLAMRAAGVELVVGNAIIVENETELRFLQKLLGEQEGVDPIKQDRGAMELAEKVARQKSLQVDNLIVAFMDHHGCSPDDVVVCSEGLKVWVELKGAE